MIVSKISFILFFNIMKSVAYTNKSLYLFHYLNKYLLIYTTLFIFLF